MKFSQCEFLADVIVDLPGNILKSLFLYFQLGLEKGVLMGYFKRFNIPEISILFLLVAVNDYANKY